MIESGLFYLICTFAYIQGSRNNKRKLAMLLIVSWVFLLSFAYQPLASDDLTREYSCLDGIRKYGWEFFSMGTNKYYSDTLGLLSSSKFEGLYVTQVIYYIFAHLPIYNFLPAAVVAFQFILEFKLLEKIRGKFELTQKELVFLFLLFFLTRELRWMMTGIRNQLAFTISVYILYRDLVEHKNMIYSMIGLILCGMIHQSALIFLVFRLILLIPSTKVKLVISLCSLLWSNLLELLFGFVQRFSNIPIVNSLLWKLTIYTQNDSGANKNIILRPYYFKMIISDIGLIVFSIATCYLFAKLFKNRKEPECVRNQKTNLKKGIIVFHSRAVEEDFGYLGSDFALFILLITCTTIGSNMYYWFFLRFAMVLQIGLFVLSGSILYEYRMTNQYDKRNQYMIFGMIAIILKFTMMMLVANTSFNFDLLGFYPR